MIDEKYIELVTAYLDDSISPQEQNRLNQLIDEGKIDKLDLTAMENRYKSLEALPVAEPSEQMRHSFYSMIEAEKAQQASTNQSSLFQKIKARLTTFLSAEQHKSPFEGGVRGMTGAKVRRLGLAVCMLLIGMLIGNLFMPFQDYRSQMNRLSDEVSQMKKVMALSLLDAPSSTARLKAVNISSEIVSANDRIIRALFKTLNNDPNVNVRLASIDALLTHAKSPSVREGLIQSIARQESPQIQVALANAMLALQETDSIDELQQLLKKNDLQPIVRKKLNTTIAALKM